MIKNSIVQNTLKKKYHSLKKADDYYRAEIKLSESDLSYQLKLKELNGNEVCFLIKEDSSIFNKLEVGNVLEMKYWIAGKTKTQKFTKAKVKNITEHNQGLLNGQYLVYLSISERSQSSHQEGKDDLTRKYQNKAIQWKASADKTEPVPILSKEKSSDTSLKLEEKNPEIRPAAVISDSDQKSSKEEKGPVSEYLSFSRSQKKYKVLAEIEVFNGNGFEEMARMLGNYLKKKGFNLIRLRKANSSDQIKSKSFYSSGQVKDACRFMQENHIHPNTKNIVELKDLDNKSRYLIAKDMVPHNDVNSKSIKKGSLHPYSILLSSCRQWDRAQTVLINYQKKGLAPYVVKVEPGKNEVWWRIFTGYYKTRKEALKVKNRHNLSDSIIMKTPYTNLIGSFSSETEATEMFYSLRKLGYSPYIVKTAENNYELIVGAFQIKIRAEKLKLDLESKGVQNKIIER
jgi:cell division septation protein DedD